MEVTNDPAAEAITQPHIQTAETQRGCRGGAARAALPIKQETIAAPYTPAEDAALMHTLRVAAAARARRTVYVVAQSQPMMRVDGEISVLDSEPALTAADVERLVLELAPARGGRAAERAVEWLCRRAGSRPRSLPDVPRSSRSRRDFPDDPAEGDLGRSARPDAGSAGALPAVRRPRARDWRARQRQVDAAQRLRGSDQPDAQRPCHHDRVADRLRAREPPIVHQPARDARRRRDSRRRRCAPRSAKIPT